MDRKIVAKDNRIAYLEKQLYGQRTEKHLPVNPDALQLSLFHNAIDPEEQGRLDAEAAKDEAAREKLIHIKEHDRQVRKVMDTSRLPVREEHLYPEMENPEDYREIGEPEVTESLVLIPQQMYIRRIVRHKMVLRSSAELADAERKVFVIAPLPPAPLHKCMASESLLADIILQKFLYHMPFYRVIQRYREMGVTISDSTMGDWYAAVCEKLKILYDRLKAEVLSCDYVQVDESTIPVIDNEKRKTRKGYMWCVRDVLGGSVFFHYDLGSRSTRTAMTLLK
ncbi:MAG: transposase, partial [Bacteroidales bacterium]|nr:transposase [Bacteroidales bacterium]